MKMKSQRECEARTLRLLMIRNRPRFVPGLVVNFQQPLSYSFFTQPQREAKSTCCRCLSRLAKLLQNMQNSKCGEGKQRQATVAFSFVSVCMHVYSCVYMNTHICMYMCMHVDIHVSYACLHACVYTCGCMCVCTCAFCVCMHMHTCV